jgi:predicted nucleotidyltransferase
MNPGYDDPSAPMPDIPAFILAKKYEVERICAETRVAKMWVFGSALREDFDPGKSDLDFVVEFDESDAPGISDRYFTLVEHLEKIFQRPVDLVTSRSIKNRVFAESVKSSIRPIYAA